MGKCNDTIYSMTSKISMVVNNDIENFIIQAVNNETHNITIEVNAKKIAEALEKQIPRKPIHDGFYYHCLICNGIVYKGRGCAVNDCRQAIDWEDENNN